MTGGEAGSAGGLADAGGAFDIVVIGAGLAGLTAGLFAARYGHSVLVIEPLVPGGQLVNVTSIEDFPGFPAGISGFDLGPLVQEQAEQCGARFAMDEVTGIEPAPGAGNGWQVVAAQRRYQARAVIIASGTRPKALGVPGEARLAGRGISHCASCDGPLFAGKVAGVAGNGDVALQEALTLAGYVDRVIIFTEDAALSGQETYRRRVAAEPKIEVRPGMAILEVHGDAAVTGVRVRDRSTGAESSVELAALFVYAGAEPNTAFLRGRLRLEAGGRVPVDTWMRTELPGVFAAGDVRRDAAGHAITAAGDGATAAIAAHRYLETLPANGLRM